MSAPALDVFLTPAVLDEDALYGRAVVVVDVLRASTTIVTALENGARAVIPVADKGEAGRLAASLDADVSLLGGERGGERIPGYQAGNSPLEYTPEAVAGRTVVLTTTNGTAAMARARSAADLAVGAFTNADAAAAFLRRALDAGRPAAVLCAGSEGRVSLEDTLCAGLLVTRVVGAEAAAGLSDSVQIASALYRGSESRLARTIFGARHTQRLIELGHADDVAFAARIDASDGLPVFRDSRFVLDKR
ncbi:2-phosphosulfolactate phosphatase [Rubrivirga litoralis]|uniref:Probable 2-phosphosulfolactate phosphatase n=1 Tax=Rubrivirga litoralis TaxID=3075598 RepID=A0ABU3BT76_9BACT|nr:2-phosphosulfolactate phosphatase [Rubrivirga sp. F394]MDT0632508.1 2-phosphosulfolactate phosphatase [Rubrivirga sp. F394]